MPKLVGKSRRVFYFSLHAAVFFVVLCLVPSDEAYYRFELLMSQVGPLGSLSQQIRSTPTTAISIVMESTQNQFIEVEDVEIYLRYAVNPSSQVKEATHSSDVLGEERAYWVYLPPGYEQSSDAYPAMYLLHGMSQNHRWWVEVARIDRIATSMIEAGKMRPAIIVMPNGNQIQWNVATTSLYDNRCQTGLDMVARVLTFVGDIFPSVRIYNVSCDSDFAKYITNDIVGEIDSKYRTNGENYIGGFSLGGRGAVQLALAYGDVFDGAFGLSGNYDFVRNKISHQKPSDVAQTRLFLGSGNNDQRGVYGSLNTFLFHRDLVRRGIEHVYCTFDGAHSSTGWVSAMPQAFHYLLGVQNDMNGNDPCLSTSNQVSVSSAADSPIEVAKQDSN